MRYLWTHIENIVSSYNGGIPLTHFLKNYFKLNPKLGSRDRKILSEMSYSFYRCAKGLNSKLDFEQKIKTVLYLCSTQNKHALAMLPVEWQESISSTFEFKVNYLSRQGIQFSRDQIFPFDAALSDGIVKQEWLMSMLHQPALFIRLRKKEQVLSILQQHNIAYKLITDNCISLDNGTPIDKLLPGDSYVVQDASSQQTGNYFHPKDNEQWWDCCSGAGGKSLLLCDLNNKVKLTVSDKRESILHNLQQRFKQYHLKAPQTLVLSMDDAEQIKNALGSTRFDNIICDVPCTGSGTWARTPEQLYFFEPKLIETISSLQSAIAINASQYLKPGGRLFYITCSVFEKENEEVVNNLISSTGLQKESGGIINGIHLNADSMFINILHKA